MTAKETTVESSTIARRGGPGGLRLDLARDYVIVVSFVVLFLVLSVSSSAFLTTTNLLNIVDQSAALIVIGCGMTIVVIAGGFDLSVGAVYALSAVVGGLVANATNVPLGILAAVAAGLGLGILNGVFLNLFRVNSFIGTLASSLMFRGLIVLITGGTLVVVADPSFRDLGRGEIVGVRWTIVIAVAVVLLTTFVLTRTTFGRYCFAVGSNADAATLSGIRVGFVRAATFAISGLCAGAAGILATSRVGAVQPDAGTGLELTAIAAVVIGGTSILGGEGAIWRTVLGVLLLALIGNGFNIMGVDPYYQTMVQGAIIFLAVGLDSWSRRRR